MLKVKPPEKIIMYPFYPCRCKFCGSIINNKHENVAESLKIFSDGGMNIVSQICYDCG